MPNGTQPSPDDELKSVTESLYKQNLELAVKNKTLSLLRQLYQISILALEPRPLAEKISKLVRETLELELVGIFSYVDGGLAPISLEASDRLIKSTASQPLASVAIPAVATRDFLKPLLEGQRARTEEPADIWGGIIAEETLAQMKAEAHLVTTLAYPLVIDGKFNGVLLIGLNRTYDRLSPFEEESLESLTDVTAVALDRARLYEALKAANAQLTDANDRLKELDRLKDEFLSVASHQLRAPMAAIRGYAANIVEGEYGDVPEGLKSPLGTIQETSRLMVNSIEDYLNISRIEQGRMKFEKSEFDIADLARKVVAELTPVAKNKGLTLSYAGEESLTVNADIGKMKQVITNLTDNAIKYTEQGSVTVSVEQVDGTARITIADTGIGIAPDELSGLFEKFTRARGANKVNTSGTGLGLYVAKVLTEGNGGSVRAESDGPGKGSRFIAELPR